MPVLKNDVCVCVLYKRDFSQRLLLFLQNVGGRGVGGGEGGGKDMNQTDEPGLSLAVIDPFAPGMIQISFGHFCLLLFDTHPQRA